MSRPRKLEKVDETPVIREDVQEAVEMLREPKSHVTRHLDRDPNDPRNRPETKALPSLNDVRS
jgi:hypothetical protein